MFWLVDNGPSDAARASVKRRQDGGPRAQLIDLPIHASWLNQIELYFSIVQRKALTPNDCDSLEALNKSRLAFGVRYREIARPFEWIFTLHDLNRVLAKIAGREPKLRLAA